MKGGAKDNIVEETATLPTRSSLRRRKREEGEGADGPGASPASKRVKKQTSDASESIAKTVKQGIDLKRAHSNPNEKPLKKYVSKPMATKAEKLRAPETALADDEEAIRTDSTKITNKRREKKEPDSLVDKVKKHQIDSLEDLKVTGQKIGSKHKSKAEKNSEVKEQPIDPEEDTKGMSEHNTSKRKSRAKKVANQIKEVKEQGTDIEDEEKDIKDDISQKPSPKRKRKTKDEKEAEAMPLAVRTAGLRMFVGAHVSTAKGLKNSITNCQQIGGNAFALFLQSQRKWVNPPLTDESRDAFLSYCNTHKYDASSHVLPHGSYLVNLAQEDPAKASQAYSTFLDDLQRCERLGIKLYNFHPGAAGSSPLPSAIKRIATQLNTALSTTQTVIPLLENMAGSGSVIGSRFSDLRDIISHIKPEFRSRIGVCIDTCHTFAAGYDLRSPESFQKTLQEFDDVVGMKYLKALHLNDSKAPLGSKRDLHQNIGLGFLGLQAFHNVMNEARFENLPLILETPCEKPDPKDPAGKKMLEDKGVWAGEIKLLEKLIGMDADSEEFRRMEKDLSEKGREEREKMMKAVQVKEGKEKRKLEKGQKSLMDMMNGKGRA